MSAARVLVVLASAGSLAGCGVRMVSREPAKVLFPEGAYSDPARRAACFEGTQQIVAERPRVVEGPAAVPGDDARAVVLSVRDQSQELEVEAMEIRRGPWSGSLLFAGTASETRFADGVSVYPGPHAQLQIRFLLRSAVRGGLFEHLTYCYQASVVANVGPEDRAVTVVLSDLPNHPPREGPRIDFDPPRIAMPLPAGTSDDPMRDEELPVDEALRDNVEGAAPVGTTLFDNGYLRRFR